MAGNEPHGTGRCNLYEEMEAFDALGPLSRAAISNARYQIGAASLCRGFAAAGVLNFHEPAVDRAGARCVRDLECRLAFQFGLERDAAP